MLCVVPGKESSNYKIINLKIPFKINSMRKNTCIHMLFVSVPSSVLEIDNLLQSEISSASSHFSENSSKQGTFSGSYTSHHSHQIPTLNCQSQVLKKWLTTGTPRKTCFLQFQHIFCNVKGKKAKYFRWIKTYQQ